MEYKPGFARKEVGTTPALMDQHAANEIDARRAFDVTIPRPGTPLGPLKLGGYTALIVLAAVVMCGICAGLALLALVAVSGRDGAADFMTQLQFDVILKTRVSAVTFSVFYIAAAGATLLAARLAGRGGWRSLLALCPIKPGRGRTLVLSLATLVYAAAITFAIEISQDHHLVDSGPTDVVLLGTILTNLCVLAPIAEELFFRGWLYTGLRARFSFWPSYLATAALFAAIHWYASVAHMLRVLPLAAVLGLAREWKGSIKPTIALHAVYNLTIVLITLAET